jgi:tetratricopeptide (TPR) repeat protein
VIARLLLAVGTAGLLVVALEGGARFYEEHPPWEEALAAKKPSVLRIAVVGGSVARGIPVPEFGFVSQLKALLPSLARFRSVQVVNRGRQAKASRWARRAGAHALSIGDLDALVVLTAHNEFLNRSGENSALKGWIWRGMLHSAFIRLVLLQVEGVRPALPERLHAVERGSPWWQARLEDYRRNLTELVREARQRGVPVLLLTAPINLVDWPPVHHRLAWDHADPEYDAHVAELEALVAGGEFDAAERMARSWRQEFGEDAMFTFLEGRVAYGRGDLESARRSLIRAADMDPYPWRVLSEQNAFIRELAREDGVRLVDIEAVFARWAPGGLVGFNLVSDNVHPTPLGAALIALEVATGLRDAGLPLSEPGADPMKQLEGFLGSLPDSRELEHLWLVLNGRYAMKTPFYLYADARRYLEAAHALAPRQWMGLANLGSLSLLEGRTEAGLAQLREAAGLRGEPIDPKNRRAVPMLGAALEQAGLPVEAIGAFPNPR